MIKIQLSDQKIFLDTQQASGYNEEDSEDKKKSIFVHLLWHTADKTSNMEFTWLCLTSCLSFCLFGNSI